jgi:hypothetical protein
MKRTPRVVILATVTGRSVALKSVSNGSAFGPAEVRRLALDAGLDPQGTSRSCYIGLSALDDFEALAEHRGIVVQRVGQARP